MMEAGAAVDVNGNVIFWHHPRGRTSGSLPDSRQLWDVLWENRDRLLGFAHSHPGSGVPGPSHEDLTTFAAVEAAIGRPLVWWITSSDRMVFIRRRAGGSYERFEVSTDLEPKWVAGLRAISLEP